MFHAKRSLGNLYSKFIKGKRWSMKRWSLSVKVDAGSIVFLSRPFARHNTKNWVFDPGQGLQCVRVTGQVKTNVYTHKHIRIQILSARSNDSYKRTIKAVSTLHTTSFHHSLSRCSKATMTTYSGFVLGIIKTNPIPNIHTNYYEEQNLCV